VSDAVNGEVIGAVGTVTVATRGADGIGEVLLRLRGGSETYLARSEEPLPKGTQIVVVDVHGARTVTVVRL
jgi:membrane protein implicated in regulation of membrane protease activity